VVLSMHSDSFKFNYLSNEEQQVTRVGKKKGKNHQTLSNLAPSRRRNFKKDRICHTMTGACNFQEVNYYHRCGTFDASHMGRRFARVLGEVGYGSFSRVLGLRGNSEQKNQNIVKLPIFKKNLRIVIFYMLRTYPAFL